MNLLDSSAQDNRRCDLRVNVEPMVCELFNDNRGCEA
jgi:hypothetical protein